MSHLSQAPSPRIQELIRQATTVLISDPEEMFTKVDEVVLAAQPRATLADPELIDAIRASNHSNLAHWAAANIAQPGLPIGPNHSDATLGLARLIARRGIEDTSRVSYGAGQNAAWTEWMRAVFSVTSDAAELAEVLDISARSIFDFVERMLALLREEIERERGQALSSANARRLALINRMLAGDVSTSLMEELRYRADTFIQTSVILTRRDDTEALLRSVERVTVSLGPQLRGRPLAVVANVSTVWAWFPSGEAIETTLTEAFRQRHRAGVQVAVGPSRPGWEGFRAHADAAAALEVANSDVVSYDEVILAAMVRGEPERVREYVRNWTAGLTDEMKETLRAYLAHRCSPSRTAAATYTHRNTIIDRVRRAEARLRYPIEGNELRLAFALELDRFF